MFQREIAGHDIFITSDEHYNHERIIKLAKRPFSSVEEMNNEIESRFNKKVPLSDFSLTIHVGDMFWHNMDSQDAHRLLQRLHGKHWFLYGNHDELIESSYLVRKEFDYVIGTNKDGGGTLLDLGKQLLYLHHYAHRVWHKSHAGSWHVFGHTHNGLCSRGKSFDIGVDGHNFEPWSLDEIKAKMATLPQHHIIDKELNKDMILE